jgi:hypothetical protein
MDGGWSTYSILDPALHQRADHFEGDSVARLFVCRAVHRPARVRRSGRRATTARYRSVGRSLGRAGDRERVVGGCGGTAYARTWKRGRGKCNTVPMLVLRLRCSPYP